MKGVQHVELDSIGHRDRIIPRQKQTGLAAYAHHSRGMQEQSVHIFAFIFPEDLDMVQQGHLKKGAQIFLSSRFALRPFHGKRTQRHQICKCGKGTFHSGILAPSRTPQYAKTFSPAQPYPLFSSYILTFLLHHPAIHSADRNTRSLGEHS